MSSPLPEPPRRPSRPTEPLPPRGGCLTLLLAAMLLGFVMMLLLMLPILGNIGVAGILFIGLFAVVATFHYFVWGRLITRLVEQDEAASQESDHDRN